MALSLRGRVFNFLIRRFVRARYGDDPRAVARKARRKFGSPRWWQAWHVRGLEAGPVREAGGVSGEWLQVAEPRDGAIFYIHGGGYVSCSEKTHRPQTATLARLTRRRVFSLRYRLAPEAEFPAALDDAVAAYRWLLGENGVAPESLAVAGDSAGGGLALALLLRLRAENLPLPAAAVCFSAWTDLAGTGASYRTNAARDDLFYPENIDEFARAYLGAASAENPLASPARGAFGAWTPPVHLQVGSTEMLLDDSRRIHEQIQAAGGRSELLVYDRIFHGWQTAAGLLPEADDSLKRAADFIDRNL